MAALAVLVSARHLGDVVPVAARGVLTGVLHLVKLLALA